MRVTRQQIDLTTVACAVVTIPETSVAQPDRAATGCAIGSGEGNDAGWGGTASTVIGIVVDVDFASVVRKAVAIPIASQAARNRAEPVGAAGRRRLGKRAGDAGVGCASGLRVRLGYAFVVAELLIGRTLPVL